MFRLLVFVFVVNFSTKSFALEISVSRMGETHDQEIATKGEFEISKKVSDKALKACIPQESIPFPTSLPNDMAAKIFSEAPMEALMKCSRSNCAFNFNRAELTQLEKVSDPETRKKLYFEFYKKRVATKQAVTADEARLFIRADQKAFEDCESAEFKKLLDKRPVENPHYRLSHIQYNPRMRPTTRLLQGAWFNAGPKTTCYAETLIFSDHYDSERIEVWSVKADGDKTKVKLQIRHRLDLLNTWLRRLNKEGIRVELDDLVKSQLEQVADCFNKH